MLKNQLLLTAFLSVLAFGCQKSDESGEGNRPYEAEVESVVENPDRETVIGRQLPNPYSVSNMRRAYRNLNSQTRSVIDENEITATHLYVQFMPSSYPELNSLQIQTDLDVYLVPLDREFTDGWSNDVDPEYSTNGFQYRWCAVPVERDLSNIDCPYEILEELYIPDDFDEQGENLTRSLAGLPESFVDELVKKSYELCGLELTPVAGETRASYVYPSGNITAWDSSLGRYVGNEGMKVKAVRGFKTSSGFCDATGYFKCNKSFKYSWTYHMYFGRDDFEVREGDSSNEIVYNKYSMHSKWTYVFGPDTKESVWSAMFRAAFRYYYRAPEIRRPPENGTWDAKLAIQAFSSHDTLVFGKSTSKDRFPLASRPIVEVYYKRENKIDNYQCDTIFGTVVHELAHKTHWRRSNSNYSNSQRIIRDSYANGIEWELTHDIYVNYSPGYSRGCYTGIMQDLIDDKPVGQRKVTSHWYCVDDNTDHIEMDKDYQDNVSGYTIKEIEDAFMDSRTWEQLKTKVKTIYPNRADKDEIDAAFEYWGFNSIK